ncbi:hypothetical protein GTZ97_13815 [Aquabacterium fontiphilum]|jgi:hypothetical protein|uniref:hypothetical protein n=1 Tax=Aquabacterium fontiphilum TaxID=450365 RepID=UPI001377DE4F|nr:hypothetical protein [Aquabacterium fontiphilum]NBD21741.1 hypothetical protein [Aquabacterium fontiphilum]
MSLPDHPAALRAQLQSPLASERAMALHALLELADQIAEPALARELHAFADRGVPYFDPEGLAYRAWVARAVALFERAGAAPRREGGRAAPAPAQRVRCEGRLRVARALAHAG